MHLKLSIVSDEISLDFQSAVEIGYEWGLHNYELRGAWLNRVPYIPPEGTGVIKEVIKEYGINITALSPGAFKVPLHSEEMEIHRGKLLMETFKLARELHTQRIIIFGVKRSPHDGKEAYQEVIDIIGEAAHLAEKEGFILMLENEAGWWADTGKNTAKMVKDIGSEALKINWDPGNAFAAGDIPYPDGYRFVKDWMINMHVKRAFKDKEGERRLLGVGEKSIDWGGQIIALAENDYQGYITIETHTKPKIKQSKECLEILKKMSQDIVF